VSDREPKLVPTSRDREVIETVCLRVRLLTVEQVARTWWPEAKNAASLARRRLLTLAEAGYLRAAERLARPELELSGPLAVWCPGDPLPSAATVSHQGRSRFRDPPRTQTVFWASPRTLRSFVGVEARAPRANEVTHDLHLAQVYLRYRTDRPQVAAAWRAEWMPRARQRSRTGRVAPRPKPDAFAKTPDGGLVIEFIGHYTRQRIETLHMYCETRGYCYELW